MPRRGVRQESAAKRWCFTCNNYGIEEFEVLKQVCVSDCSFACIGEEVGANGTPHLQGFVLLRDKARLSHLRDRFNARAHWEVARGSSKDNERYCSKEGRVWSTGICPGRDVSKSRDELAREYNTGLRDRGRAGIAQFEEENPGAYAWSGHILLRNYLERQSLPRRDAISVTWLYGQPGVGKSRLADRRFPGAFRKCARHKWWSGYINEREVIIDDYGRQCIDIFYLLTWFDRYPCSVETKGGIIPLCADTFVVTSNYHPDQIFVDPDGTAHMQLPALLRRMTVIEMTSEGDYTYLWPPEAVAAGRPEAPIVAQSTSQ